MRKELLSAEGLAVGAGIRGGVNLVGTHQNPVQRAVILTVAVVGALLNGTFDTLVCMAVHIEFLLFSGFCASMARGEKTILEK